MTILIPALEEIAIATRDRSWDLVAPAIETATWSRM